MVKRIWKVELSEFVKIVFLGSSDADSCTKCYTANGI